jgi:hypothetical protein
MRIAGHFGETMHPVLLALNVYEAQEYMGRHELSSVVENHDLERREWRGAMPDLDSYAGKLRSGQALAKNVEAIYIGKKKRRGGTKLS